jgi:hypothetical protein
MSDGVSAGAARESSQSGDQGNDSTMSQAPEPTSRPDSGIALASGSAVVSGAEADPSDDRSEPGEAGYEHAEDGAAVGGDRE